METINALKQTIFWNILTVIVELPNDYPVRDFRFLTKIQKIDTTRSHGMEIKHSSSLLGELRVHNEKRLGESLKQMDLT